jgi:tetratricopeptide (TPR) repeat protein
MLGGYRDADGRMYDESMGDTRTGILEQAQRAETATLWEDAARLYEQQLSSSAGNVAASRIEQAAILTALGRCYRSMGEARAGWRSLMRAIALFREEGDTTGVADATLEALRIWAPRERQHALAEDALASLGSGESRMHAALLLHLDRIDEGRVVAEKHGYADMLAGIARWNADHLIDEGRIDEYVALARTACEAYSAVGDYERASGNLRQAGYAVLALGDLDRGGALAREACDLAGSKHLRFEQQLAGLDVAGVLFARCELASCERMLDAIPGDLDFRKDLFHAWIAELRGESGAALALLPSRERAGGAFGALSQVHSGRAGVLFRAGKKRAAEAELHAWADAARHDGRLLEDAPAMIECLLASADEALLNEIIDGAARGSSVAFRYSTLQGRGLDLVRGAIALQLGMIDDAARHFQKGAAWASEQRLPLEEARCLRGLAEVTAAGGGITTSY